MSNRLVLPGALESQLIGHLLGDPAEERLAVIFAGRHRTPGGWRLLGRETWTAEPSDYLVQGAYHLEIEPRLWARAAKRARATGESLVIAHSHPGDPDIPDFSPTDDWGEQRLLPKLRARADGPHATLVVASGGSRGRLHAADGSWSPLALGGVMPALDDPLADDERFDRQRRAVGPEGQARLRSLSVGVVGLGGLGSHVVQQLLHLGVAKLVVVEPDRVEPSNLSRLVGATYADAIAQEPKLSIARRMADGLDGGTELVLIRRDVREPEAVAALLEVDFVFGCTDTQLSRLLLNALAHQYYRPVLDLGVELQVEGSMGGRVTALGPDAGCLWCWGILSSERLRAEQLPPELRAEYVGRGYVTDFDVVQPAVVSLNGVVASLAVTEMLRRVTGMGGRDGASDLLLYRLSDGTVRRAASSGRTCPTCAVPATGAGDLVSLPGRIDHEMES
jgi:molybdopterin/thiamine biosynthesis adenylyltransferase